MAEPSEAAPTPPRAVGRVARPGPPVPPPALAARAVEPHAAPTVHAPTAVDHGARTLLLLRPAGPAGGDRELAIRGAHAAEVCLAAARASLEDGDDDAARGYLARAAAMLAAARGALR